MGQGAVYLRFPSKRASGCLLDAFGQYLENTPQNFYNYFKKKR